MERRAHGTQRRPLTEGDRDLGKEAHRCDRSEQQKPDAEARDQSAYAQAAPFTFPFEAQTVGEADEQPDGSDEASGETPSGE